MAASPSNTLESSVSARFQQQNWQKNVDESVRLLSFRLKECGLWRGFSSATNNKRHSRCCSHGCGSASWTSCPLNLKQVVWPTGNLVCGGKQFEWHRRSTIYPVFQYSHLLRQIIAHFIMIRKGPEGTYRLNLYIKCVPLKRKKPKTITNIKKKVSEVNASLSVIFFQNDLLTSLVLKRQIWL